MATPSHSAKFTTSHIGGEVILPTTSASPPPRQASRQWVFTHFGDNEPKWDDSTMKYLVFQREKAKTTDRLHWQGYVILKQPTKFRQVQTMLDCKDAHMEISKAIHADKASNYCMKIDTRISEPKVFGKLDKSPGKRTDLLAVGQLIKDGTTAEKIFDQCPDTFIRYHRGIAKAIELKDKQIEDRNVRVEVFWGKSGSGKSKRAREDNPGAYWKSPGPWWDRYEGNACVILDDFSDKQMSREEFLRTTDRYPYILPVKGGTCYMKAIKIVITSNYDPKKWYGGDDAVLRRLTLVEELGTTPPCVRGAPLAGGCPVDTRECVPPPQVDVVHGEKGDTDEKNNWEWLLMM